MNTVNILRHNLTNFGVLIASLFLFSCTHTKQNSNTGQDTIKTEQTKASDKATDEAEIQALIRKMLAWSESKNNNDILPMLTDSKDSLFIGFDLKKHQANLDRLRATNFFSAEFIETYNQIILTLDKKLKNKEFEEWSTGDLPPFNFANDVNVWCLCQDEPTSDPWNSVEIEVTKLTDKEGDLYWKWGNLGPDVSPDWKEFRYPFKVKKESGKWKISYLQGFDFKESVK